MTITQGFLYLCPQFPFQNIVKTTNYVAIIIAETLAKWFSSVHRPYQPGTYIVGIL
jgi:hypothetical protein